MRIIFLLVIAHCFGCVNLNISENNFIRNSQSIENNSKIKIPSRRHPSVSSTDVKDQHKRYDSEIQKIREPKNPMIIPSAGLKFSNFRGAEFVPSLSKRSAFISRGKDGNQVSINKKEWGTPLRLRLRNILEAGSVESETNLYNIKRPRRGHRSNVFYGLYHEPMEYSESHGRRRFAREDDWDSDDDNADEATSETDADPGEWDEWTEWSECSLTCGCGRQVRWRHCSGSGCVTGLKKAQIRMCHLRDCNRNNFLSWLGMKS